jgi:hypothetical protein
MPLMVLAAKMCPKQVEASFYAFVLAVINLGYLISYQLGGLLTYGLNITANQFTNLWILIIISNKNKGKKREGEALDNLRKGHKKRILNINGEKISQAKKGHECYKNPERTEKIKKANLGKKRTEETKQKMSKALLGNNNKPKKQIKEYDLEQNFIQTWNSVNELISYYKENNLGFDYTTFLKKQKENKPYKNRYWL